MVHNAYLFQRGRIFYFRWKVPVSVRSILGCTELRYSLHTDSLQKAQLRCRPLLSLVFEIKEVVAALRFKEITVEKFRLLIQQAGITGRYSHRYSLKDVLVVVGKLSYS